MDYNQPYEKLGLIYDRLMEHVDYKMWSEYIVRLTKNIAGSVGSVADLACGTGNFLIYFKNTFPFVAGCDLSEVMIQQACQKRELKGVPLFISDIQHIALPNKCVNLAVLLYDSLNYLTEAAALNRAMAETNRILTDNGLFIFDIVSEKHCLKYYADYHENEYWGSTGYSRYSHFDQKEGFQYNDFRIVLNGFSFRERHVQKIYAIEYLASVLQQNSFKVINIFEEFSFEKVTEKTERMHFLCQKK
jgi:SAM-dependent methyltransferase